VAAASVNGTKRHFAAPQNLVANGTSLHSLRGKKFGRYWVYSGHWSALSWNAPVANDPERPCGLRAA